MHDPDIEARLSSGGQLVTGGIVALVVSFLGTCVAVANNAGSTNPGAGGAEIGQSPILLIGLTLGIALITLGQVRKSNARRDAKARYLEANTRVEVVLDEEAPDGPFRGAMTEVESLDPIVAAAEQAERERARRRGAIYLAIGGAIMGLTAVGILTASSGGDTPVDAMERVLVALGLGIFTFGLGLYFAIKGLLLRSD